jgi:hypothetical protein
MENSVAVDRVERRGCDLMDWLFAQKPEGIP